MSTEAITPDTYAKVATAGESLDGLDLSGVDRNLSAGLKITHTRDVHGRGLTLPQCRENSVDIDVAEDTVLDGVFGTLGMAPASGQAITVKGGSARTTLSGEILSEPGRQGAHIQVGNWMDQDYRLTSGTKLDFKHRLGGPVYVVTGWVVPFSTTLRGACEWRPWESLKLKIYVVAKFVVRFLLRIPKGTKGPAWF